MGSVYVVQHSYEHAGRDEVKFIGVYSTRQSAEAAVERTRKLPGFREHPDDFHIDEYALDEDSWTEGFIHSVDA
jgi:homoserine kinase type II